jgi:hypothetical protein
MFSLEALFRSACLIAPSRTPPRQCVPAVGCHAQQVIIGQLAKDARADTGRQTEETRGLLD